MDQLAPSHRSIDVPPTAMQNVIVGHDTPNKLPACAGTMDQLVPSQCSINARP